MRKKAISPVIATVLLIAMVVVSGLTVFLWFRGVTEEAIVKFDKNIELVCGDVMFDASYNSGIISVSNDGNVPIFDMKIEISSAGSHVTKDLSTISDWPAYGLGKGGAFSGDIGYDVGNADEIRVIPVLVGESESGNKLYICDKAQYGYNILV